METYKIAHFGIFKKEELDLEIIAIYNNDLEELKRLLGKKVNKIIQIKDEFGEDFTPLEMALYLNKKDIILYLIENNAKNKGEFHPKLIEIAVRYCNPEIVSFFKKDLDSLTDENKYFWTHRMVLSILRDCVYCGNIARNKRPTLSFKNDKRLYVPKENYIVAKNTHEGIVSEEVWLQVQDMIDKRKNTNKSGMRYDNIFKGLVRCPKCNYALSPSIDARLKKDELIDFVHFGCSHYKKYGMAACSSHRIEARDLYNIVLADIQYHGSMAITKRQDLIDKIIEKIDRDNIDEKQAVKEKLIKSKEQLSELDSSFEKLYEDRLSQVLTERNFKMMSDKLTKKQNELIKDIQTLETKIKQVTQAQENCEKFIDNLSKYASIKELSRYILNQVIDVIYVYDKEEVNGEITQNVEIHYKFIGKLE